MYSSKFTLSKTQYIHNNLVEARLVSRHEEYNFSSALDYSGQTGPVKAMLIKLHNLFLMQFIY